MDRSEGIKKLADIMKGANIGSLTTYDGSTLVSRPMGLQQIEFDGDLWFFTYKQSHKVDEVAHHPRVNVTFENKGAWVSLSGEAHIVDDPEKAEELWNPLLKAWFPDGLETDGLTILKVEAESAEYWDSNSPQVVQLFGMIKAAVTGEQTKGGENETVNLS
jgi:general stress protein 26